MAFRFFHHNGVSASQYCPALDIKVEEYTNDNVVSAVSKCVTNAMQENTWKIAGWAGTISFKISGEYLAQAVANGAKSITLSLVGINSDKAIGCQWKSLTFGTVPSGYPTTCTVALSASADYSAGLTVQIYHHNGANNNYIPEALKLTITQNK